MNLLRAIAPLGLMLAASVVAAMPASALSPTHDDPVMFADAGDIAVSVEETLLASVEIAPVPFVAPSVPVAFELPALGGLAPADAVPVPIAPVLKPPLSLAPV